MSAGYFCFGSFSILYFNLSQYNAAIGDPLGGCHVTPYGYSVMLKKVSFEMIFYFYFFGMCIFFVICTNGIMKLLALLG